MPAARTVDCEKAARWAKINGVRRVAKARIADMASLVVGSGDGGVMVVC